MESAAVSRFFNGTMQIGHRELCHCSRPFFNRVLLKSDSISRIILASTALNSSSAKRRASAQASESLAAVTSHEITSQGTLKDNQNVSLFPTGFEALVLDVCDATKIAELTVKVGDLEMHLKRKIGSRVESLSTSSPNVVPPMAPPIPSMPMSDSDPASPQPAAPPSSSVTRSPFAYVSSLKESKLAGLEASGFSGYALVSSPSVGFFRSGKTVKGKKHPPNCKEGILIKEGQIIGYVDQFGNEYPVKSDVAGEVLKVLYKDGEAVGYGDPLVAVLPSFHGIE